MATFLFKTEPEDFSWDDLVREKNASWNGVSNPAALKTLRTARKGDEVLIYHTGAQKAIVGLARVLGSPYEDPTQPGRTPEGDPKFAVVDIGPVKAVKTPATLVEIKGDARFKEFPLVRVPRLSVMAVPAELDKIIRKMTGI
jgi:predicted RNA-binding protein with PUA-like domain